MDEERWCDGLDAVDRALDADFDLRQAVLRGEVAVVKVEGVESSTWRLVRHRRSWRILLPAEVSAPG